MKNIIGIVLVLFGTVSLFSIPFSGNTWFSLLLAEDCNYGIVVADPNPCDQDVIAQRCSTVHPCQGGFLTKPIPVETSCGGSSFIGSGEKLLQVDPNGGNRKSMSVPDVLCVFRTPCVANQSFEGYCDGGKPTEVEGYGSFVTDCCEGKSKHVHPIYAPQAGAQDCPG